MNVGVYYNGRIFVVEFVVDTFGTVYIIGVEEADRDGNQTEVILQSDEGQRLANDQQFQASCIYAVADWNGENFDYETFRKRLN